MTAGKKSWRAACVFGKPFWKPPTPRCLQPFCWKSFRRGVRARELRFWRANFLECHRSGRSGMPKRYICATDTLDSCALECRGVYYSLHMCLVSFPQKKKKTSVLSQKMGAAFFCRSVPSVPCQSEPRNQIKAAQPQLYNPRRGICSWVGAFGRYWEWCSAAAGPECTGGAGELARSEQKRARPWA